MCKEYLKKLQEQGKIKECMCQERLKGQQVQGIWHTLTNTVQADEIFFDGRTIIYFVVDNMYLLLIISIVRKRFELFYNH